jgi:hypothetical protein
MNNLLLLFIVVVIILSFGIIIKNKRRKNKLRKKILADGPSNYGEVAENIALSISKSKALYKELIVKVHPDRFLEEKKDMANELASKITKSKRNFEELSKLKTEVDAFLS